MPMRISLGLDVTGPSAGAHAPAVPPWTPTDLGAALKGWWDAGSHGTANMTDDGAGLISSWKDKISGVNATATTTARPTWSATSFNSAYAGVSFTGATPNNLRTTTFTALPTGATAGNIAALVRQNTASGFGFIFQYGSWGSQTRALRTYLSTVMRASLTDETTDLADTVVTFTGNHIAVGEWSGTTMKGWVDGTAFNPASATKSALNTPTAGELGIGIKPEAMNSPLTGVVRHIFVTTLLTTLQRQQLEGWMAWDTGLTSLLPAGHPYKSVRP